MIVNTSVPMRERRQQRVRRGRVGVSRGSREVGTNSAAGEHADGGDGSHDDEDAAPPEVLEQPASGDRPERRRRAPVIAPQIPIALARSPRSVKTLVMIDSVAGKISAAPMPISRPDRDQRVGVSTSRTDGGSGAEHGEPDEQRALAAEAVAEAAGGEHQPGEDEVVGVDDPLQLAWSWHRARGRASARRRSRSSCRG